MKPRLLIILNRLAIGGPAMNTLALASRLGKYYEILLIAGEPLPHEHNADHLLQIYKSVNVQMIREFTRNIFLWKDYRAYLKIKAVIREFNPQIVHTHGSKPGVLGRWAAHRMGIPIIIHTYHGHVFHSYFPSFISRMIVLFERKLAIYTDILIAINSQLKKDLTKTYRIAEENKLLLSPLGLDPDYYKLNSKDHVRQKIRNDLSLSNRDIAVVSIGRLVPVKQHRLFVHIASVLVKHHAHIPFRFFLAGDGPERERLITLAKDNGLKVSIGSSFDPQAHLHFLLWRKDVPALLSGMDIMLHTSLNEGTPVSILEAMAMGKPVVATPVGGISELIDNSEAGFVSFDPNYLIEKIILLATREDIRKKIGDKGQLYVEKMVSIDDQVAALVEQIEKLKLV